MELRAWRSRRNLTGYIGGSSESSRGYKIPFITTHFQSCWVCRHRSSAPTRSASCRSSPIAVVVHGHGMPNLHLHGKLCKSLQQIRVHIRYKTHLCQKLSPLPRSDRDILLACPSTRRCFHECMSCTPARSEQDSTYNQKTVDSSKDKQDSGRTTYYIYTTFT